MGAPGQIGMPGAQGLPGEPGPSGHLSRVEPPASEWGERRPWRVLAWLQLENKTSLLMS